MTEIVTRAQLNAIMPIGNASGRLDKHWPYINPALAAGGITSPKNVTCFLAQCAHESGEFQFTREIADGSDYEGRVDLGNVGPGDGTRYPGRGGIQVTGRAAARACGLFFGQPFEAQPELMETPQWATHVSVWFWSVYKTAYSRQFRMTTAFLPVFAEMDWFKAITKGVNGGYNHLAERIRYRNKAREVYGLPALPATFDERLSIMTFQAQAGLDSDGDAGGDTAAAASAWIKASKNVEVCSKPAGWHL